MPAKKPQSRRRGARKARVGGREGGRELITSHEVAALAGVSRSAVSRTFTPDASVSDETRQKVMRAAAQLGYQPNVIARSLITRRSRLIGLIMGEWENPFYTAMLRQFSEKLQARDYRVMLLAGNSEKDVDDSVRMLRQYQVDGIVLVSTTPSEELAAECARAGVRLVLLNRDRQGLPATSVVLDNAAIGRDVASLLLQAGYRQFVTVRGRTHLRAGVERQEGFRDAIRASGLAEILGDGTDLVGYAAGREFICNFINSGKRPDAVVCSSDLTAIGVLDGLRIDLGVNVPADIAVVGFGDIPAASWAANELTTVALPLDGMIDAALDDMFADDGVERPRRIVLPGRIIARATTRRISPAGKMARG
ncbi:MAG: LacI family DNA-binding transcriptional regulator [Steroidobacteraceae bacterium]|nr:LacI family DNA-binding transcriptional regulator [Steroidobacteraceae bacterium]